MWMVLVAGSLFLLAGLISLTCVALWAAAYLGGQCDRQTEAELRCRSSGRCRTRNRRKAA